MLTKELVQQAILTSHKVCAESPEGCVHADALQESIDMLGIELAKTVSIGMAHDYIIQDLAMSILNNGIHIGYRLRELEATADATPVAKEKVN